MVKRCSNMLDSHKLHFFGVQPVCPGVLNAIAAADTVVGVPLHKQVVTPSLLPGNGDKQSVSRAMGRSSPALLHRLLELTASEEGAFIGGLPICALLLFVAIHFNFADAFGRLSMSWRGRAYRCGFVWGALKKLRALSDSANAFYTAQTYEDVLRTVGSMPVSMLHIAVACGQTAVRYFDPNRMYDSDMCEQEFRGIRQSNRNTPDVSASEALHTLNVRLGILQERFQALSGGDGGTGVQMSEQRGRNTVRANEWQQKCDRLAASQMHGALHFEINEWGMASFDESLYTPSTFGGAIEEKSDFVQRLAHELSTGFLTGAEHGRHAAFLCGEQGDAVELAAHIRNMRTSATSAMTLHTELLHDHDDDHVKQPTAGVDLDADDAGVNDLLEAVDAADVEEDDSDFDELPEFLVQSMEPDVADADACSADAELAQMTPCAVGAVFDVASQLAQQRHEAVGSMDDIAELKTSVSHTARTGESDSSAASFATEVSADVIPADVHDPRHLTDHDARGGAYQVNEKGRRGTQKAVFGAKLTKRLLSAMTLETGAERKTRVQGSVRLADNSCGTNTSTLRPGAVVAVLNQHVNDAAPATVNETWSVSFGVVLSLTVQYPARSKKNPSATRSRRMALQEASLSAANSERIGIRTMEGAAELLATVYDAVDADAAAEHDGRLVWLRQGFGAPTDGAADMDTGCDDMLLVPICSPPRIRTVQMAHVVKLCNVEPQRPAGWFLAEPELKLILVTAEESIRVLMANEREKRRLGRPATKATKKRAPAPTMPSARLTPEAGGEAEVRGQLEIPATLSTSTRPVRSGRARHAAAALLVDTVEANRFIDDLDSDLQHN